MSGRRVRSGIKRNGAYRRTREPRGVRRRRFKLALARVLAMVAERRKLDGIKRVIAWAMQPDDEDGAASAGGDHSTGGAGEE